MLLDWFRCDNCKRFAIVPWHHSLPPASYDVNYWQWVCKEPTDG